MRGLKQTWFSLFENMQYQKQLLNGLVSYFKIHRSSLFYLVLIAPSSFTPLWNTVDFYRSQPNEDHESIPYFYIIQEGDNLITIATRFETTVDEIIAINDLAIADSIYVGQKLIIPNREGVPIATTYTVEIGDTISEIAERFNTTVDSITVNNYFATSHTQPIAGTDIKIVSRTGSERPNNGSSFIHIVQDGETLLSISSKYGVPLNLLILENAIRSPTYILAGQKLKIPLKKEGKNSISNYDQTSSKILAEVGGTIAIYTDNLISGKPEGILLGQELRFFEYQDGYVALFGIDAFTNPGVHKLNLIGSKNKSWNSFQQKLLIEPREFQTEFIPIPDDLDARQNENEILAKIYRESVPDKMWDGLFTLPVANPIITGSYGNPRSYNGAPIANYHSGNDFAGDIGTEILAPANGKIAYIGDFKLRGKTLVLDHGLGVMTAYFHLSDIFVGYGDLVEQGQVLAAGGSTGLSTGPHLHWEFVVNGVPVDGLVWTKQAFP